MQLGAEQLFTIHMLPFASQLLYLAILSIFILSNKGTEFGYRLARPPIEMAAAASVVILFIWWSNTHNDFDFKGLFDVKGSSNQISVIFGVVFALFSIMLHCFTPLSVWNTTAHFTYDKNTQSYSIPACKVMSGFAAIFSIWGLVTLFTQEIEWGSSQVSTFQECLEKRGVAYAFENCEHLVNDPLEF